MREDITVRGAREHNLKDVDLTIPKRKVVVLTGLSGSGKSTLAMDILHREGQRQYLESLGMVTDFTSRPNVDAISGLSPSISVDQHLSNRSPRSTVGTSTEVYTYLRVLFARIGHRPCPSCGMDVPPLLGSSATGLGEEDTPRVEYLCPHCGHKVKDLGMADFSFNKPAGACPSCTGLGVVHQADLTPLLDEERSAPDGVVLRWDDHEKNRYMKSMLAAAEHYGFELDPSWPIKSYGKVQRDLLLHGVHSPQFEAHFPDVEPPASAFSGRFEGIVTQLLRRYDEGADNQECREKMGRLLIEETCAECRGERLREESRRVTVAGSSIIDLSRMPLSSLLGWIGDLPERVAEEELTVVRPIRSDLEERIKRLIDVGVGYLTMERSSPTLSAGEAQRLRLAALLGSGLTGVLYVLDEPTIGLHQRDTKRLISVLHQLRDLGNTVLVIEHDMELISSADHVIDIGPGAGRDGGRIVAQGTPGQVASDPASVTGAYLSGRLGFESRERRRGNGKFLTVRGARENNLKDITVTFPLGTLIAVTGVSGSGKSSLMFDILDKAGRQRFRGASDRPGEHDGIEGWGNVDSIVTIDQEPIGRVPRSNAATYTDAFTAIRSAFASTPEARSRGLTARHFSFNVPGGRCERCEGAGVLTVPMHFLPPVEVRCPVCQGRRFRDEVLEVRFRGHDISEVLSMTIEEALPLFQDVRGAGNKLALMAEVGMGYLQLGQPATTLSGGEAQRIKLAKELGRRTGRRTVYLLDEPTTGLHPEDTRKLLDLLQRLVDAGNTVMVVEHNLDVIAAADHVVDLGPEGGDGGGRIMAQGTPEEVMATPGSRTGECLAERLRAT